MDLSIQLTPYTITGSNQPQAGKFSKTFIYRPPDENLHQSRGELFTLIFFSTPDLTLDLEVLTKQAWDTLQQEYFGSSLGSPPSALKESLKKTKERLASLIVSPQSGQERFLDFNLLAVAVWGNTYFSANLGENGFWLLRNQALQNILAEGMENGQVLNNDFLILSSAALFNDLGKEQISEILLKNDLNEAIASLKEEILQKQNPAAYCLLLIEVKQNLVPSEEEIIEIVDIDADKKPLFKNLKDNWLTLIRPFRSLNFWQGLAFLKRFQLKGDLDLYIKKPEEKGKGRLLALIGLTALFAISLVFTRWYRQRGEQLKLAQNLLATAQQKVSQGKELASLNPEQAKKLLNEASDDLGKVKGMEVGSGRWEVGNLEDEIKNALTTGYKIEQLSATLTSEAWPRESYQFDTQKGIVDSKEQVLLEKSSDWQKVVAIKEYFGNLYLLDVGANQIHKYIGLPQGFSKRFDYFKATVDLSGALDFAIDANIYILFAGGRVQKYLGGERVEFVLSGFYPPLENLSGIFTSQDNNSLYLFSDNQILIFDKEGGHQKTFEFNLPETNSIITNIFVNEFEKTIWLKTDRGVLKASY